MKIKHDLNRIGLTDYEITAYTALVSQHPLNGSQLSKQCGIPRARIYDVLRSLKEKGFVAEPSDGTFIPLPPSEMIKRLRQSHESDLQRLETILEEAVRSPTDDFVWTIKGRANVLAKAREMIESAETEIYVRLFPQEGTDLEADLEAAGKRGVEIKYILMKPGKIRFKNQVIHPESDAVEQTLGGRSLDLVVDREEILTGMFKAGMEERSPINWGKNQWFVLAGRDSLRHDFFHYFLHRTYEEKQTLTDREQQLYERIMKDV